MSRENPKSKSIDYDKVSKVYDNVRVGDPEMVHQLLQGVHLESNSLVLDVGCGTGNNTLLFGEATHARVTGLDISYGMLEKAREKMKQVPLVQAPVDTLPFTNDTFQLVFMTEVIHHLPDPHSSIEDIYRVLVTGGSLCIVTQSHRQIEGRMTSRFFPASASVDKDRYPDIDVIEEFMQKSGFETVSPREYQFRPTQLGEEYLNTARNRGYSMLHKISQEEYEEGLQTLEAAFASGEKLTYSAGYTFVWAIKE
ncbi:MAG: class I SAM-dependent methyltransferase [Candidatus Thorarchaeota archaeon]|jgi:ubiquinone/menaquinone biosynthesis C-methylase UbiE